MNGNANLNQSSYELLSIFFFGDSQFYIYFKIQFIATKLQLRDRNLPTILDSTTVLYITFVLTAYLYSK